MKIEQLHDHEILALVAMAKHLIHLDDKVSNTEMADLVSLGEAIGMKRFKLALETTGDHYKNLDAIANIAARVERYDARVFIYVLLEEVGKADGADSKEQKFLDDLGRYWELK